MSRPTVIVFARAPAIGVGKSRLARDVGAVEAWRAYRTMTARLLRRLADPRWRVVVRITPDAAGLSGFVCEGQGGGDLGARLERAIRAHARGPVAVIGTDAPDVTPARIARAFDAARPTGAAIGPAEDGGFWILALSPSKARRIAFPGVRWSTPDAFADTRAALAGEAAVLEVLADVDDGPALRAWRRRARL
ncbi:DUF2064 domain-containing protein [Caulobacter sp. 17J80-11]|uniref:TIGR04282 family arsenosugar biosynthesis glycosyltransferase n=1 Tax=Caulobacter sp. 17J80-11 TaxID=2763502 RepID=UPI001653C211|nr:DUF2064 domain-containing protein [Caulobacter sp. 17J80-11]MBC6981804.1 DUF2064 domain-containing protein [Caulobacter sp. 17J80-11]